MEQTVSTIKAKRKQQQELQQVLDQLEKDLTEQVLADTLAALKREVPLLESIEAYETRYVSHKLTFTNNVTLSAPGGQFEIVVSFGDEQFRLSPYAIRKPGYVFKHKLKATRVAVNEAVVAWQKLLPLMDQVLPSNIKRRCLELNTF